MVKNKAEKRKKLSLAIKKGFICAEKRLFSWTSLWFLFDASFVIFVTRHLNHNYRKIAYVREKIPGLKIPYLNIKQLVQVHGRATGIHLQSLRSPSTPSAISPQPRYFCLAIHMLPLGDQHQCVDVYLQNLLGRGLGVFLGSFTYLSYVLC